LAQTEALIEELIEEMEKKGIVPKRGPHR